MKSLTSFNQWEVSLPQNLSHQLSATGYVMSVIKGARETKNLSWSVVGKSFPQTRHAKSTKTFLALVAGLQGRLNETALLMATTSILLHVLSITLM